MPRFISINLLLTVLVFACKSKLNDEEKWKNFSETTDLKNELTYVFTNGFGFTKDIKIEKIGVYRTSKDIYRIVYFLDEESNFDLIGKLNIAFRIYPQNPNLFQTDSDKRSGARTLASRAELKRMGSSIAIVSEDFKVS